MERNLAYYKGRLLDLQDSLEVSYTLEWRLKLKTELRDTIRRIAIIERRVLVGSYKG